MGIAQTVYLDIERKTCSGRMVFDVRAADSGTPRGGRGWELGLADDRA